MKKRLMAALAGLAMAVSTAAGAATMNPVGSDSGTFSWNGGVGTSLNFGGDSVLELTLTQRSEVRFIATDGYATGDVFQLYVNGFRNYWDSSYWLSSGHFRGVEYLTLGPGRYVFDMVLSRAAYNYSSGSYYNYGSGSWTSYVQPAPVPLPAGLPLLLAGLGAFAIAKRRKA